MAQICVKCGKKIGVFADTPLCLQNDEVLCANCGSTIINEIREIEKINSLDEYLTWYTKLEQYCITNLSETIANQLDHLIRIQTANIWQLNEKFQRFTKEKLLKKNLLLTTTQNLYGYRIIKYNCIVSGQVVMGTGLFSEVDATAADVFGSESNSFSEKLEKAKNIAMEKMIIKSVNQGGNALIGVDFDYITFRNNMIGVVANGTSVIIEPESN